MRTKTKATDARMSKIAQYRKTMSVEAACAKAGLSTTSYYNKLAYSGSPGKKKKVKKTELVTFELPADADRLVIVIGKTTDVISALALIEKVK